MKMAPSNVVEGFWGKPTATLDWCEENYVTNKYIAEFWNTTSNVIMILPPLVCALYNWNKGLEMRYILANLSILAVGVGSWMFHMTLWYEMQLLDELPMIYGTCVLLYALHHHASPVKKRSYNYIISLIFVSVAVTVVYLQWKHPIFHQVSYAVLVFFLLYEAILALKNYPAIKAVGLASLCFYLFGFFLWNIDNIFCSHLRNARASSNNPLLSVATQLHAWWHIFTGYGTYLHILFSSYARLLHLKRECKVTKLGYVWPYLKIGEKI
uniref:alkaline ceramidase 3-like isoform X3 n=2 Tax=Ciona intestinalis TaxID=7719 RepID=UPI0005215ADA|nr:alkaline ceramidase 3-like isoform X3 [Ciona intestinalis]|eukprot:XP_009861435.1 alkaline ceramidase 3-like isoform X3 [Ciona intestinalis]